MNIRCLSAILLVVLVLVASRTDADVITDWNSIALDAIRADSTTPPEASRALAIMGVSVYDAVNAVGRTYEPYKFRTPPVWGNASKEAAAATAAFVSLTRLYPEQSFLSQYQSSLSTIPRGPEKLKGILLGTLVSTQTLVWRAFDGSRAKDPYQPTDTLVAGRWQPTPPDYQPFLLPQWGDVKPFAMTSGDQFRQPPPPDLTSDEYTDAFNRVKELGSKDSSTRTVEQTEIAFFWADGAGTVTPPGHFFDIALDVSASQGNTLEENARLFALLGIAVADAGISAWDMKKNYDFWRPSTGIQNADLDENPDTVADKDWEPLLNDPNFPAYVSGHSTFSSAAATILADFFDNDDISFASTSDDLPGVTRYFDSFSEAAGEAGMSRIYGGIHWDFDALYGQLAGEALGHYVFDNFLTPLDQNTVHTPLPSTLALLGTGLLGLGALGWRRKKG